MMRIHWLAVAALTLVFGLPLAARAERLSTMPNHFPTPAELEPDVQFWTRIYTEVDTRSGLLHDSRDLSVVYEQIHLPDGASRRGRERHIETRRNQYSRILRTLARGKRKGLSPDEARVLRLFPDGVSNSTLSAAASRVRFQLGQADKFRAGLVRAGAYYDHIQETLTDMGLPLEIAALPHVESSYTPHAYSRVGAAGLWQFTRSTGRRYMRVDHVVDERLDPYRATVAAARLLEQNLRVTGSWPLAITAYNHGASGMRRAVRKLGTTDITTIVRKYRSRTFGFASRNFYVEFLAASQVAADPERYFGTLVVDQPIAYETVELPFYTTPEALSRAFGVDIATLKEANPALRAAVWDGAKRIPRGFELSVPQAALPMPASAALESIDPSARYAQQTRDTYHVVRRGETLSQIARRYHVRMSELQALNGLRSRNRIHIGQKLRLPADSVSSSRGRMVAERSAPPADGLYTVRRGDSISQIARRFGMSQSDLLAANDLPNRHRIYAGQVLRVSTVVDKRLVEAVPASRIAAPPEAEEEARPEESVDAHPQALALLSPAQPSDLEPIGDTTRVIVEAVEPEVDAEEAFVEASATVGVESEGDEGATTLLADPNDYSVASDGTVEVQATETLGHYAEWLGTRASTLRAINHLRYGEPLPVHARLKLDFSRTTPEAFESARIAYHQAMQEEFFARWEISGTETHRMRRGDSIWVLTHRKFNVPLWLLRQYNPDIDFERMSAGTKITVPMLRRREWDNDANTSVASAPELG
jgi:membrane-bound lytic murein transglycosylase D